MAEHLFSAPVTKMVSLNTKERKSHTSSLSSRSPFSSGDSDLVESINFLRKPSSVKKKWKKHCTVITYCFENLKDP